MSKHARVVLQDCRFAISRHSDDVQAEAFRTSWLSVLTLLRGVGYVLSKVDAHESAAMKAAVQQKWGQLQNTRPEPTIFWEFIKPARDLFVKTYTVGVVRNMTLDVGNGSTISIDLANARGEGHSPGARLASFISLGAYRGRNDREIAWMAYDWWSGYLDEVDELANRLASNAHI